MSEFDDIQQLIRLKRHESPPGDFVDDFVRSFHERQRSEMLHRSARGLLWERITTYFSGMLNPKWAWATATVAAVAILGFMLRPDSGGSAHIVQNHTDAFEGKDFAVTDPNAFKADVESYLKAVDFDAAGNPGSQLIISPKMIQLRQDGSLPVGLRFDVQPWQPQR